MVANRTLAKPGLRSLSVLFGAFTILVFLHTIYTPVFEAPDEIWHYAYVRWIAEGNGLPSLAGDASGTGQQSAQPPLYYLLSSLISRGFGDPDLAGLLRHNPGFGYQAPGTTPDNKNMLIHTADEAWPWHGAVLSIHATRLTSLLFGLVTVASAWGLSFETTRSRRWALVTSALVAFQPQFVFISSVVSNDSAAAALSTAGLWVAMRLMRRGATFRRCAVAGAIAGLGILTKTSVLLIVPLLGAAVVWSAFRQAAPAKLLRRVRSALSLLSVFLVALCVVGGWWYVRNALTFGDPLALQNHTQTPWGRETPARLLELLPEVPVVARSFWGAYGWGHVTWPNGVYVLLWAITLPLVGLAVAHLADALARGLRSFGALDAHMRTANRGDAAIIGGTLALLWLGGIAVALLRWMQQVEAPHGRLLFPAIGAWALLLTIALQQLTEVNRRAGHSVAAVLLALCAALATLAPGARIASTFASPKLVSPSEILSTCERPTDLRYGEEAQLLCVESWPRRAAPGDIISVKACWTAVAPLETDYTVFVHLIGPEATRVAERHTYPGLGKYPTSMWQVGSAFCDTYTTGIESWADAPMQYRVEVGLFDAETGERLIAHTADGLPYDPPIVGAVDIVPTSQPTSEPNDRIDATFDDGISLVGDTRPARTLPGSEIEITLFWEASAAPIENYVAFIHLWRPGDDAPLTQTDSQPRGGWYPTTAWTAGETILDTLVLKIPDALAPGTYPLWAGLYRPQDGVRLAVRGPEGRWANDLVPLGALEVGGE